MRLRIILPVLAAGLLLALGAWLVQPGRTVPTAPPPPQTGLAAAAADPATAGPATTPVSPTPAPPQVTGSVPGTNAADRESAEAREQAYVEGRINELMDLAMDDQPASLQIILSELNNRDPEIRHAAVEAAMQFGSRDAIPRLQAAAEQTDDAQEKVAINDAIEFLKLPTPAELAALRSGATPPVKAQPAVQKR